MPQIYHYLGGVRHLYWDHAKYGNQVGRWSRRAPNAPLGLRAGSGATWLTGRRSTRALGRIAQSCLVQERRAPKFPALCCITCCSQADKHSPLEVPAVEASSKLLLGASAAATVAAALYSI